MTPPFSRLTRAAGLAGAALAFTVATAAAQVSSLPFDQKMDVIFGEVHGTGLLMDVFTPRDKTNGLGLIDVASGAYKSDRGKIRDHMLAQLYTTFCARGYTVFAIRPGSRPRYTAMEMTDHLKLGIRYVKEHAAQYRIDPDRLGLTGASAGGHLAALAALTPEDARPGASSALLRHNTRLKAVGLFFPPTDFLEWEGGQVADMDKVGDFLFFGGAKDRALEEIKKRALEVSPARLVKTNPPPFIVFHGDADPVVPLSQSEKLVAALKAAGGSAELVVKKGGGHPWFTIFEEVRVMADWFDKQLATAP